MIDKPKEQIHNFIINKIQDGKHTLKIIDNKVEKLSLWAWNMSWEKYLEKYYDLYNRKTKLLQELTSFKRLITKLTNKERYILYHYYIKKKEYHKITKNLQISTRTFFRCCKDLKLKLTNHYKT